MVLVWILLVAMDPSDFGSGKAGRASGDCLAIEPSLRLSKLESDEIVAAVRRRTRFQVVHIEPIHGDSHVPRGTIQAVTLVHGSCERGEGDIFWVRKQPRGWRAVKRAETESWGSAGKVHGAPLQ